MELKYLIVEYHITSNEKGEAILSSEQTEKLNEIIKKLNNQKYKFSSLDSVVPIIENLQEKQVYQTMQ